MKTPFVTVATGTLFILVALCLQYISGLLGLYANFVFATLIVFAFTYTIWEFCFLILFAVFLVNWQPAPSLDLFAFAAIPFLTFVSYLFFKWNKWMGSMIAIALGTIFFYVLLDRAMLRYSLVPLLIDVVLSLIFGELVLFCLE